MRARGTFLITSRACPPSQTSAVLGRKPPLGLGTVASAHGCGWGQKRKVHAGCAGAQDRGRGRPASRTDPGRVAWGHEPLPGPWSLRIRSSALACLQRRGPARAQAGHSSQGQREVTWRC